MLSFILFGQSQTITGYVIDKETNQPILDANILLVGTDIGSSSDENGKFIINWTGSFPVKLNVSHIAYETMERRIKLLG